LISAQERRYMMELIEKARADGLKTHQACDAVGITEDLSKLEETRERRRPHEANDVP